MFKSVLIVSLILLISACGGGGGASSSSGQFTSGGDDSDTSSSGEVLNCVVIESLITITEGSSCVLSLETVDAFSLTGSGINAGATLSCVNGAIQAPGLSAGGTITISGLTLSCAS